MTIDSEPASAPHILIVEDDANTLSALADMVRREGFVVHTAVDLASAREQYRTQCPQVIVADLVLPDGRGSDLLVDTADDDQVDVIILTGNASVDNAVESLRRGAYDYLTKPIDQRRLKAVLTAVRTTRQLKQTISTLRGQLRQLGRFGPLVGTTPAMQHVYGLIERVAPTDSTVLLTGESGTGKELAARAIHQLSRRATKPLVALNCGAVAPSLIESHLFGHEKGAFTGAMKRQAGYFERAEGGTLLLDEVTEMPLELQVKLLRVLETRRIQPVGSSEERPTDVRIIAATNRDPEVAVEKDLLREDLYYRLKVFPIEMPPLWQRTDDIEILALYMLVDLNQEMSQRKRLSDEALRRMMRYRWPGNVRELKNVLRRAFVLADAAIEPEHLPPEVLGTAHEKRANLAVRVGMSVAEVERKLIVATLQQLDGNKPRAAEVLGMSLKTLYNRLNDYADLDRAADEAAAGPRTAQAADSASLS